MRTLIRNGTVVDGHKVRETTVRDGAKVRLGNTDLVVRVGDVQEAAAQQVSHVKRNDQTTQTAWR